MAISKYLLTVTGNTYYNCQMLSFCNDPYSSLLTTFVDQKPKLLTFLDITYSFLMLYINFFKVAITVKDEL